MYFAWENLRGGFCCCWFHFCIFISYLYLHFIFNLHFVVVPHLFFFSFTFSFRHHPSPFRGLSPAFYTHFIISAQPIVEWFATLSLSTIPLSSYCERYGFEWALFTHRRFLPYAALSTFYLRLWTIPWEPEVLPWSLQGFILILKTQTRPICLFDSQ